MESISSREFQADAMCHVKDVESSAVSEKILTSPETEKELTCASACESIELSLSCTVIPSDVCNSSQLDGSSTEMDTLLPDEDRTSGDTFNLKGEFNETDMPDDHLMLVSRSGRSLRRKSYLVEFIYQHKVNALVLLVQILLFNLTNYVKVV